MSQDEVWTLLANIFEELASITALFFFRKSDNIIKLFSYYLFLTSIVELSGLVLWKHNINNSILYSFYDFFEFVLLTILYSSILKSNLLSKNKVLLFGLILLIIVLSYVLKGVNNFEVIGSISSKLILSLYCLIFFRNLFYEDKDLKDDFFFWVTSGLIFYNVSSLLIIAYTNYLISRNIKVFEMIWSINSFLVILKNCCFIIGFFKQPYKSKLKNI